MGNLSEFHCAIRCSLRSTTVTVMSGHLYAITLHVGPPTYPAPMQQIFFRVPILPIQIPAAKLTPCYFYN